MTLDASLEPYENLTEEPMADEDFADQDIYEAAQWAHAEYLLEKQERTNHE